MDLCKEHLDQRYTPTITFVSPLFQQAKSFVYVHGIPDGYIGRALAYMANPNIECIGVQGRTYPVLPGPTIWSDVHPEYEKREDYRIIDRFAPTQNTARIIWKLLTDDDYDSECVPQIIKELYAPPECLDCCIRLICEENVCE